MVQSKEHFLMENQFLSLQRSVWGTEHPSTAPETPLRELCTNTANSSPETNLLCLLINIYSGIYQENMKGKSRISSMTHRGISLNTLGHRH